MASMTSCGQAKQPQARNDGVVINGIMWATRNVDEAGTFAPTPESAGKFYQWNRKKAYSATYKTITDWDDTTPEGTEWGKANDPSPAGWRVPTIAEIETLFDTTKVSHEFTKQNGVFGRKLTDKLTGNSIFIPAARCRDGSTLDNNTITGYYWSTTLFENDKQYSYCMLFDREGWMTGYFHHTVALSIRSVAE